MTDASRVQIDEIDEKILHMLIKNARISLKEISDKTTISSVSVLNRIKRLRKVGVITGATLFPAINKIGFEIVATIGMQTDENTDEVMKFLNDHTYMIEPSTSIGEYDLCAVVYAENIKSLNEKVEAIRRRFSFRKIVVNVWSGIPEFNFDNIDLRPKR